MKKKKVNKRQQKKEEELRRIILGLPPQHEQQSNLDKLNASMPPSVWLADETWEAKPNKDLRHEREGSLKKGGRKYPDTRKLNH